MKESTFIKGIFNFIKIIIFLDLFKECINASSCCFLLTNFCSKISLASTPNEFNKPSPSSSFAGSGNCKLRPPILVGHCPEQIFTVLFLWQGFVSVSQICFQTILDFCYQNLQMKVVVEYENFQKNYQILVVVVEMN